MFATNEGSPSGGGVRRYPYRELPGRLHPRQLRLAPTIRGTGGDGGGGGCRGLGTKSRCSHCHTRPAGLAHVHTRRSRQKFFQPKSVARPFASILEAEKKYVGFCRVEWEVCMGVPSPTNTRLVSFFPSGWTNVGDRVAVNSWFLFDRLRF